MKSHISKSLLRTAIISGLIILTSGCAAVHSTRLAYRCDSNISTAKIELEQAKSNGYSRSVSWTKAASLLTAAKMQQRSEKFPNCINKTARARYYINRSQNI